MPSGKMRKIVSQNLQFDLNMYALKGEYLNALCKLPLDKDIETDPRLKTLGDAISLGLNIGHCGLTSRYFLRGIANGDLVIGKLPAIAGSKNSPNGEHAWVQTDNLVIDPTLLVAIPTARAYALGYKPEYVVNPEGARILSEYDTFSNELHLLEKQARELEEQAKAFEERKAARDSENRETEGKRLCYVQGNGRKMQVG